MLHHRKKLKDKSIIPAKRDAVLYEKYRKHICQGKNRRKYQIINGYKIRDMFYTRTYKEFLEVHGFLSVPVPRFINKMRDQKDKSAGFNPVGKTLIFNRYHRTESY
jgi:hypothetical protein